MIGCALIGTGYWGSKLRKYLAEHPNLDIKVECDSKSNLDEVFRNDEVDVVVIATPTDTQYLLARKALMKGKHLFCEKPLSRNFEECISLISLAKDKKLCLVTDYTYNFSTGLNEAKKIIDSGKYGDLLSIDLLSYQMGKFRKESVYWLLGAHMLSIVDMFVPLAHCWFERMDLLTRNGNVETGMITFTDGKVWGNLKVSINQLLKGMYAVFLCSEGAVAYCPQVNAVMESSYSEPRDIITHPYQEGDNLRHAITHLYDCLKGKAQPNTDRAVMITKVMNDLGVD